MYQYLIPILLIMNVKCHTPKNHSDVIITYEGHAEAYPLIRTTSTEATTGVPTSETTTVTTTEAIETGDIVFVPNGRVPNSDDEFLQDDAMIKELSELHGDANHNYPERRTTEPPDEGVVFVSGKNDQNEKEITPKKKEKPYYEPRNEEERVKSFVTHHCKNLNCNSTVDSVCGAKLDRGVWRFRLFLNECYYRKVNCAFRYEQNRYRAVTRDHCKEVGTHLNYRPSIRKAAPSIVKYNLSLNQTRRNLHARRSMPAQTVCGHPCPVICSEDYEPECAQSSAGEKKVFMNHCKLDYISCTTGVAWFRRALSDCVGGQKASLQQNRRFIDWMQRVGIVDKKGRLVLN